MVSAMRSAFLSVLLLLPQAAAAATVPLDISGVRPGPIGVVRAEETVAISWPDETGREWRAVFSLDPAKPLIASIGTGADAIVRDARPFYQGETGKRRGGWYAFFDDPTTHPEGTRHVQGTLQLRGAVRAASANAWRSCSRARAWEASTAGSPTPSIQAAA